MLQYALYNDEKFLEESVYFPVQLAYLKILGSLAAEIGNLLIIVRLTSIAAVVRGYASMAIVANADNIMAKTLQELDIGGEMGSIPLYFKRMSRVYDDWEQIKEWRNERKLSCFKRIFLTINLLIYRCIRFFYICVYYYFIPFLTLCVVHLGTLPNKLDE